MCGEYRLCLLLRHVITDNIPRSVISFPNAKINLGLNVINKRSDGFHDIESCFYPIPWHDTLEILECRDFNFHQYGLPILDNKKANLCVQAYELLKSAYDIAPVEIHLIKGIPAGAGMGGGSADGAFTLMMLNELFQLGMDHEAMKVFALALGSDCPFFIENQATLIKGRGEKLITTDLDLNGLYLAIYNPSIHVSTQQAFLDTKAIHPNYKIEDVLKKPIKEWSKHLQNQFEETVFLKYPIIKVLKKGMYDAGAVYASMTGSGSTVYGLFEKQISHPEWKIFAL